MEIPRFWRTTHQRIGLKGIVCPNCDEKIFPPRPVCPNCHGETTIYPQKNQDGVIFNMETISLPREVSNSSK